METKYLQIDYSGRGILEVKKLQEHLKSNLKGFDSKHQDFINSRNAATAKHEEVKAKLSEIRKVNKFMDQAKAKPRARKTEDKSNSDLKEKEQAEEIFQKFKDGKKLTTEEFLLLQKYNIM